MYVGDSLFTLTIIERLLVLGLSGAFTVLTLWLVWCSSWGRAIVLRVLIALFVFILFVWLSPQAYYTLYLFFFDGLPRQIVVGWPPSPQKLFALLTFTDTSNLSHHGQGALGWALIALAILRPRIQRLLKN